MAPAAITPVASPADRKSYRAVALPNGLSVLLIHDPEIGAAPAAAAARGLAHHEGDEVVATDDEELGSLMSGEEGEEEGEGSSEEEEEEEGGSEDEGSSAMGSEAEHEHVRQHRPHARHAPPPAVKKAAAALSVGVGYFSDPWHLQGLSHYLEHMLFMGSTKYPDENDYDAYLSAQGGSSNACTEEECTTFHFECKPDALRPALDRFAQFFISPLCKAEALGREVQAVDNEFSGVLQSDSCRLQQLRCHAARDGHVFRKFGWGNIKSLAQDPEAAGIDVRSELLAYYKQQYSAERMNLVVLGGEPLDELEAWVRELFSSVPGGRGSRPHFGDEGMPFVGGRLLLLPSVRDEHRLNITFQLPCLTKLYRKKAEDYISHFVGHEGRGSLLSALKARGWATELWAGVSDQTSVASMFDIGIALTEAGVAAAPGAGLACVLLVFQYLALLRQSGPQRWAYEELAAIAQMRFRFQEEEEASELVSALASDLHAYPPVDVLSGPYLFDDWDPELISQLLASMTAASACIAVSTHAFEQVTHELQSSMPGATRDTEPWFSFSYMDVPLHESLLASWAAAEPGPDLALPPRNDYVASDFSLHCCQTDTANSASAATGARGDTNGITASPAAFPAPPTMLVDVPGLRLWHKLDATFRLPRAAAYLRLASPALYETPRAGAGAHLLVKLLENALCETAYLADVAGLPYSIWPEAAAGIDIKVNGFSHKLPLLVEYVFSSLAGLAAAPVTPTDFERVKEALVRSYRNLNMRPPKHATYLRLLALKDRFWHGEAVLAELERLTAADVQALARTALDSAHVEALLHGNLTAAEAERLARTVHAKLGGAALGADARLVESCVQLPAGALLHRAGVKNPEEDNSVVEVYWQCGPDDVHDRALVDMVEQLLYEPCYDTLRTKEQLGYTVHSGMRLTHGVLGFAVVVVSAAHGPEYLDARVDAFLNSYWAVLQAMTAEEFEQQREALLAQKLMKERNMLEESDRAWEAISSRRYNFQARREEVEELRKLTAEEVQRFYAANLLPSSPTRRKLSVHVVGRAHLEQLGRAAPTNVQLIGDPATLKHEAQRFPPLLGQP